MRGWLVVWAAVALLGGAQPALADTVSGFGFVVAVDVGEGELRLDDGTVLKVTDKTVLSHADGRRMTLGALNVSEDAEEPVRFEGELGRGAIMAHEIVFGVEPQG
jgi:hypothetical protein